MTAQLNGKIFLANDRGCSETDTYRSYRTFNFEDYLNEHKTPFGNLHVLNDETLAAGNHLQIEVEEETYILLLPIVGTISCKVDNAFEQLITAGQLFVSYLDKNRSLHVSNPYNNELINFLQIRYKASSSTKGAQQAIFTFDLDENKNGLISVTKASTAKATHLPLVSIGKFGGRQENVYHIKNPESSLFVFVIEGVFEVQGRLLHSRDGLGLWNEAQEIELGSIKQSCNYTVIRNI